MKLCLALVLGLVSTCAHAQPSMATRDALPPRELVEQGRQHDPRRYALAQEQGAELGYSKDGLTFYLLWMPPGRKADARTPVIVTLHGHGSYAFDEFALWHRAAAQRGYGVLALQWWLGKSERFQDYLTPHEIYRTVDQVLSAHGVKSGQALLHGFSRGSANCYAVEALDRQTKHDYFALVIANAGKPGRDFPPNVDIERGRFGAHPFAGTHWVLFCGGQDPHPERDGCAGMAEAGEWVKRGGGQVDAFIQDPQAGHGGFHRNPANMERALDVFAKQLAP